MPSLYRMRRGAALIWSVFALLALVAFAGLSVDWARVTLVRTQLRQAADAAALAAAARLGDGAKVAEKFAEKARLANLVDGKPAFMAKPKFEDWDDATGQYRRVIIEMERSSRHGGAVPLTLGQVVGMTGKDVKVRAVAQVIPRVDVNQEVLGTANPFLSGMPRGTVASLHNPHNSPDYAGDVTSRDPKKWRQSPIAIKGLPLVPGQVLTFDNIAGTTRHDPNLPYYAPDGETGEDGTHRDIGRNTRGSEHGISDINAPINALVGVFLGPGRPDGSAAPDVLDASSHAARNQKTYRPKLKQIFFIGDGLTYKVENGKTVPVRQEFVIPDGATRLYLATWDFFEWNNNAGQRTIKVERPQKVMLVE
jgi:hypothetical protein